MRIVSNLANIKQLNSMAYWFIIISLTSEFSVQIYFSFQSTIMCKPTVSQRNRKLILKGVNRVRTEFLHEFEHHTADVDLPGDSERHVPVEVSDVHLQLPGPIRVAAVRHPYTIQRHPIETTSKTIMIRQLQQLVAYRLNQDQRSSD